jgi:hypothetical protein
VNRLLIRLTLFPLAGAVIGGTAYGVPVAISGDDELLLLNIALFAAIGLICGLAVAVISDPS